MDKVTHFEIPADDKAKSKEFYGSMFGWQIADVPMKMAGGTGSYTTATTTPVDPETMVPTELGGINGAIIDRTDDIKAPVVTISVASIEETLGKVKDAGGKVIEGRQEVEGMGFYAYITDPAGNVIGLWEDAKR